MTKLKLKINTGLCPSCTHPKMLDYFGNGTPEPYCPVTGLWLSTEFNYCEFYEHKKRGKE